MLTVNLHRPEIAKTFKHEDSHWLELEANGNSVGIFTTAERAAAMAFAFNHPEAVLALPVPATVTIVTDPEGVA